jgi:hypothetical protein
MIDGRIEENSMAAYFNSDSYKNNVESLKKETDVSGWLQCCTQVQNGYPHG